MAPIPKKEVTTPLAVVEKEGTFVAPDGKELYTKTWLPPKSPSKAAVIAVHGFNDHIGRYYDFFPTLARHGIAVYGFDQRGWGRSVAHPSERGHSGPTAQCIADLVAFIQSVITALNTPSVQDDEDDAHHDSPPPPTPTRTTTAPPPTPLPLPPPSSANQPPSPPPSSFSSTTSSSAIPGPPPLFLLGHSNGGSLLLHLTLSPLLAPLLPHIHGWILEAPLIQIAPATAPHPARVWVGRLAGRVLRRWQLRTGIPVEQLTRWEAAVRDLREDDLCHGLGTLEGLAAMLDRAKETGEGRVRVRVGVEGDGEGEEGGRSVVLRALWLGHGTADQVTCFDASRWWFDQSCVGEDKTFKTYVGWYHQLHAEPEREVFYRDVADWILERCGGQRDKDGKGKGKGKGKKGKEKETGDGRNGNGNGVAAKL